MFVQTIVDTVCIALRINSFQPQQSHNIITRTMNYIDHN